MEKLESILYVKEPLSKYSQLEDRLVDFAAAIVDFTGRSDGLTSRHLMNQLLRCGIAPALNYAEAQNAESRRDFIHKMSICLKEIQETLVCLKILARPKSINCDVDGLMSECSQLLAIFMKSVKTAKSKSHR